MKAIFFSTVLLLTACAQNSTDLPDDPGQEQADGPGEIQRGEFVKSLPWKMPAHTQEDEQEILDLYSGIDPERIVPRNLLKKTLLYFHHNRALIDQHDYISIIDYSKHSSQRRFFLIDMKTGKVQAVHVAHGKKSDSNHDGVAETFSNRPGSEKSSLGFYLTWETYYGQNGYSLRIDGLSSTNSNARDRAVVIHGAGYVQDRDVKQGRSLGCPAFSRRINDDMINAIKGGTLLYAGRSSVK